MKSGKAKKLIQKEVEKREKKKREKRSIGEEVEETYILGPNLMTRGYQQQHHSTSNADSASRKTKESTGCLQITLTCQMQSRQGLHCTLTEKD